MAVFRIHDGKETHDVEADNFTINGEWVILTSTKQSLVELDPLPKEAFIGAYKNIFGFWAVDAEGNRVELVK